MIMKTIAIFEDGKSARGQKAKLIKRGNKAVLIQFEDHDFITGKDVVKTEWFTLWTGIHDKHNSYPKYNNKRKKVYYIHKESNYFFTDWYVTNKFISDMKEWFENNNYVTELFEGVVGEEL